MRIQKAWRGRFPGTVQLSSERKDKGKTKRKSRGEWGVAKTRRKTGTGKINSEVGGRGNALIVPEKKT